MNNTECPICKIKCNKEYNLKDVFIYLCVKCTHRFSVLKEGTKELYNEEYYLEKHKNWFDNPDLNLYNKILKIINNSKSSNVLDVGCGNGNLLSHIYTHSPKLNLTGIDLSASEINADIKIIREDFVNYECNETYDFIISLATIEHIYEAKLFVNKLYKNLDSGGILFLMTMNDDSLLYKLSRFLNKIGISKPFNRLYDMHHLNHFSHKSLKKLLENQNFIIIKTIFHNVPLKSLDFECSNYLEYHVNKLLIFVIFLIGKLSRRTYLQSIVVKKS